MEGAHSPQPRNPNCGGALGRSGASNLTPRAPRSGRRGAGPMPGRLESDPGACVHNDSAAEDYVAVVEDAGLAGSDGANRLIEDDAGLAAA